MRLKAFSKMISGIVLAVTVSLGCSGDAPDSSEWTSVALRDVPATLIAGDTLELSMRVKYGSRREQIYDFTEDALGISVTFDTDMAEYLGAGLVVLKAPGKVQLNVASAVDKSVSDRVVIEVLERKWTNVIARQLHSRLIHVSASLPDDAPMSAFDVSASGDVYMFGAVQDRTYVSRLTPGGDGDYMTFIGFPDSNTFCIEEAAGDEVYVWFTAASGQIARVKYLPGTVLMPADCTALYDLGISGDALMSIDEKEDAVSLLISDTQSSGRVVTYSLSALKALPGASVTSLAPVYQFDAVAMEANSFCIEGSFCYFYGGDTNESLLAISSLEGDYLAVRKQIAADDDISLIIKYGLSDAGELDPAGIAMSGGNLYIGYVSYVGGRNLNTVIKLGDLNLSSSSVSNMGGTHEEFDDGKGTSSEIVGSHEGYTPQAEPGQQGAGGRHEDFIE